MSSSPIARKALNRPGRAGDSFARAPLIGSWKARRKAVVPTPSRKGRRLGNTPGSRFKQCCSMFIAAHSLFSERIRGVCDRGANSRIRAASTEVSAHRGVDVVTRGLRVGPEQCDRRHDLSGLAVTALRHVVLDPRRPDCLRNAGGYCFDGGDFALSDIGKRGLARRDWLPVHVDGAGAAERLPAPELCSFQAKEVSDRPQERHRRVNPFQDSLLSVDGELHRIASLFRFTKLPTRPATPSQLFLNERVEHCGPLAFEVSFPLETLLKQSF